MRRGACTCAFALIAGCYSGLSPDAAGAGASAGAEGGAADADSDGSEPGDTDDDGPAAARCGDSEPGQSMLRRLNRREFRNTVGDLLGLEALPEFALPEDQLSVHGLDNDGEALTLSPASAERYFDAAAALADAARTEGSPPLVECADLSGAALQGCADEHLADWLDYAFRRPAPADAIELARELIGSPSDYDELVDAVVTFTVTSPLFLFHAKSEADHGDDVADPYEIADRLAYLLWSSAPDRTLLAAASADQLRTAAQLEAEVDRLLGDPRADRFFADFGGLWLKLGDLDHRPEAADEAALVADMRAETVMFFREAMVGGEPMANLLDTDATVLSGRLARHYGIETELGDDEWELTELPEQRSGLLTHASVLAVSAGVDFSDPIRRGVFVAERVLCSQPPAPPFDPDPLPPLSPDGTETMREILELHQKDPTCAACHALMDPLGLALENYDRLGRYREAYPTGAAIDASGTLPSGESFEDAVGLGRVIAEREEFETCVATLMMSYGVGRSLSDDEACYVELALEAARKRGAGTTFREFLVAFATSYLFVATGEEA